MIHATEEEKDRHREVRKTGEGGREERVDGREGGGHCGGRRYKDTRGRRRPRGSSLSLAPHTAALSIAAEPSRIDLIVLKEERG